MALQRLKGLHRPLMKASLSSWMLYSFHAKGRAKGHNSIATIAKYVEILQGREILLRILYIHAMFFNEPKNL